MQRHHKTRQEWFQFERMEKLAGIVDAGHREKTASADYLGNLEVS